MTEETITRTHFHLKAVGGEDANPFLKGAAKYEPPPQPGQDIVYYEVLRAILERVGMGKAKHGTFLQSGNGRSAGNDLLQELIDCLMYAAQRLIDEERERERIAEAIKMIDFGDTEQARSLLEAIVSRK